MPTGYTAPIYEGKDISFAEFTMGCARAFGALVTMRDDPSDAPIPDEFEPHTSYHEKSLATAYSRLAEAKGWTDEDAEAEAERDYIDAKARWEEQRAKDTELRGRYRLMLAAVELWEPPTPDHQGLKDFMTEQLQQSIEFDTGHDWPAPERVSGPDYRAQAIEKAERDIEYHQCETEAEIDRAAGRTEWVKQLRDSLSGVPV